MRKFKSFTNKDFDKSMNILIDDMYEAYNNPLDIEWKQEGEDKLFGYFEINNNNYKIECIEWGKSIWTYKFFKYDKDDGIKNTKLTGLKKDSFKVMPTIVKGIEYLCTQNPKAIIYAALDDSTGRKKLYDSFSNSFSKKYSYNYQTYLRNGYQIFILFKDDADKKYLFEIIKKFAESY